MRAVGRVALRGALGALAALLLGEIAVRITTALDPGFALLMHRQDPFATLIEPLGDIGHRQRPGAVFRYGNGAVATANSQGFRGDTVTRSRRPGVLRVVLVGGSTTHGWGVNDTATIDVYMRRLFAERGVAAEVVNLGFDGYDALQDFLRYQADGVPLQPDVLVINSGINDLANARYPDLEYPDPRTLLWTGELARLRLERERGGPLLRHRVKHWSYLYRFASLARQRMRGRQEKSVQLEVVPNPGMADYFERSIRRLVEAARHDSTAVILSTPPSSLRLRFAPTDTSYHRYWLRDAATTQAWRDSLDQRFRRLAAVDGSTIPPVIYVAHHLGAADFIDDCHLTPSGNARIARDFVDAILELRRVWPMPRLHEGGAS